MRKKAKEFYELTFNEMLKEHGAAIFRLPIGKAKELMRIGKSNGKWTSSARVSGLGSKTYDVTVHFKDVAFFEGKLGKKHHKSETKRDNEGVNNSFSLKNAHKKTIQKALSEGKTVRSEVLKDYPSLQLTFKNSTFSKTAKAAKKRIAPKKKITSSSKTMRKSSKDIRDGRIKSDWLADGREADYWRKNPPRLILNPTDKSFRQGIKLPEKYLKNANDFELLKKMFGIRGFEFGKWTNYEDRYNYLVGLSAALYDLAETLSIPKSKIGLNLGIAFGARGASSALAHYEPYNHIINLTRFKDTERFNDSAYRKAFVNSGGMRSLTHEWGHAFDYFVGGGVNNSLSYGSLSINQLKNVPQTGLVGLMKNLLMKLCFTDSTAKTKTDFGKRIAKTRSKYYQETCEIFARSFEVYVYLKMKEKGYFNTFLSKGKYNENKLSNSFNPKYYPSEQEMRSVRKEFDLLISKMKQKL